MTEATTSTLQGFLAMSTEKAAENFMAAVQRLPEDKRAWCPMGKARTAIDQAAELAILNGSTSNLLETRKWPENFDFNDYYAKKDALAEQGWGAVKALLEENTKKVVATIKSLKTEDLDLPIDMPWGPMSVSQIAAYPYWNMSYHEGQVNYIASMLGCLD
jgi:hypothetical protein